MRAELDLPPPDDDFDRKLISDIHEYGWHCLLVADENHPEHAEQNAALGPDPIYDAAFAYTVGLTLTRDHPELVLVGRWPQAHAILQSAVAVIEAGTHFDHGDESDDVLEGYPVRFHGVTREWADYLLTYASWVHHRSPFDAVQLVLPDRETRWPWEDGYAGPPQPIIG
jgi:Domain of unknown function (DUF4262)